MARSELPAQAAEQRLLGVRSLFLVPQEGSELRRALRQHVSELDVAACSSMLKVSEAAAHIVQAHIEHIVQPELQRLKKLCTNLHGEALVEARTALDDDKARGILAELRKLGGTRLVMSSSEAPHANRRRLLGSIFHVHRWGLGKTAAVCVRGRPMKCSVHVLHKGKIVYEEAALRPIITSGTALQGGSPSCQSSLSSTPSSCTTSSSGSDARLDSAAASPAEPHYSLSGGLTASARMRRRSCEAKVEDHGDDEKVEGPGEHLWFTMRNSMDQRVSLEMRPEKRYSIAESNWR
eukprot:SM000202S05873  [mRNA]  locus=s202:21861:23298:- [translate_table: standard]